MSNLALFNAPKTGAVLAVGGSEAAPVAEAIGPAPMASDAATDGTAAPSRIGRFEVTREWTTFSWLCPPCVQEKEAEGARVKRIGDLPPDFGCDRCELRRQGQLRTTTNETKDAA